MHKIYSYFRENINFEKLNANVRDHKFVQF